MSNTPSMPFPLLADPNAQTEAQRFAHSLVTKYHAQKAKTPHLDTICIDLIDDYPAKDATMDGAIALLPNWTIEPREFKATSGRAGCVWMTPKGKV